MNVYCNKSENVDKNYDYINDENYDYINDENVDENYDYINDENVDETTSNVKPTSSLFDKPKPRPKSLLIYDD